MAPTTTKTTRNRFKTRLLQGDLQIGLWLALADPYAAELCAGAGFDWLLIDAEHAPNDNRSILSQLQAIAPYDSQPVVRPPIGESWMIKQLLDLGVESLLVPMVETAAQAAEIVAATRYPPQGIRGVGSAIARASRWGTDVDYLASANERMCVLLQIESATGLGNLEAIAAVPGVDGVFVGPADLSASMGFLGNPAAEEVMAAIEGAIGLIRHTGMAAGILSTDRATARRYIELGCRFVAVGVDTVLLAGAGRELAAGFASDHQE